MAKSEQRLSIPAAALHNGFALDYVETTGPVVRVGVYATSYADLDREDDAVHEAVTDAAEALTGMTSPIDVDLRDYRAEVTFERYP